MDFDLKIYIPLIASCITSTAALIIGIINWRTSIKLKNRDILINNLEKDIHKLFELKKLLTELSVEFSMVEEDDFPNIESFTQKFKPLLTKCSIEFLAVSFLIDESFNHKLFENFFENSISYEANSIEECCMNISNEIYPLAELLDNEIKLKREVIKNILF